MINKVSNIKQAIDVIKPEDTILVSGFSDVGCPFSLLRGLTERKDLNRLTLVSEDLGCSGLQYDQGPEMLIKNGQIRKLIVSYLGTHDYTQDKILNGELEVELVPQGTLAERLRAAGSGLGGFFTPTGYGTEVAEGKETRIIDGKGYLFEKPLNGDVALIKAYKADYYGNAVFRYTARNFNDCMAMAGKRVILEVEKLLMPGEIEPDEVQLPGVFVDYVVVEEGTD